MSALDIIIDTPHPDRSLALAAALFEHFRGQGQQVTLYAGYDEDEIPELRCSASDVVIITRNGS